MTLGAQILQRLMSQSPEFWKKIQKWSGAIAAVCAALGWVLAQDIFNITWLNTEKVVYWLDRAALFFAGGLGSALFATNKPSLISKDTKEAVIKDVLKPDTPQQ